MIADKELKLPFYAKATIFLIGIFALFTMLYISKHIIIPIIFAIIISIALHPLVSFLTRMGINRLLAIIITLVLAFSLITALSMLLFSHAVRFSESLPILVDKFTVTLHQTISDASDYFNISQQSIHDWIAKTKGGLLEKSSALIGQTLVGVGSRVAVLFLVPIYIFMLLFYQPLLLEFIRKVFGINHTTKVNEIISQTKKLIQRYIIGLLVEAAIVAFLYSAGLLIIGIDYAILLACIAALLNIIPYIGGLIAVSLIIIIAIATKNSISYPLMVGALAIVIHLIDNSFIIPKIVASKVKINALISITAIIASDALLGIPGMIICIPVLGIIKLIFDHIDPLKPWGFLLGDTMPPMIKFKSIFRPKK